MKESIFLVRGHRDFVATELEDDSESVENASALDIVDPICTMSKRKTTKNPPRRRCKSCMLRGKMQYKVAIAALVVVTMCIVYVVTVVYVNCKSRHV